MIGFASSAHSAFSEANPERKIAMPAVGFFVTKIRNPKGRRIVPANLP